jgi:tetratricopeptide (TPR) repeat protein
MDFKGIEDLIDNKKYLDAEQKLIAIINDINSNEKDISIANYLMGYIHTRFNNKGKSNSIASQALLKCIDSSYPISNAFYLYADVEEDKNIAINYLRKGLAKFSTNSGIYIGLLKYSAKAEQLKVIEEIMGKGLNDYDLLRKVIELLISYNIWEDVDLLSNKAIENNDMSLTTKNYLQLLSAYSKLITNKDRENILEALAIFESLIEHDVLNQLYYSHYMGAIGCGIILKDYINTRKYFDKLPVNNSMQDLNDGPWCIIDIVFLKIYVSIFGDLAKIFADDKKRRQKSDCLRALYLYNPYEAYGCVRFTKKHINDLKRYYKSNVDNVIVGCAIFNMECEVKLYYSAYSTYMDMLNHYVDPNKKGIHVRTTIENCPYEEFERIYLDVFQKIDMNFDMNMSLFVIEIVDSIVARLWAEGVKERDYKKIVEIVGKLNISCMEESDKLFEVAYSFAELKNSKAKSLYEMFLKKEPQNSYALNNIGVIYKDDGDLLKAKDYFNKAYEFDNTNEKCLNNLKDVETRLDTYTTVFEKVKNEPIWFIGRLGMFYDIANEFGEIQCTYKNRPIVLKVQPEKANELVDKMVKNRYIEKISNGNYQTPVTYRINPLIKSFLLEKRSKIESNKEYEIASEKLNIDALENIGYTSELRDLLNNISESDFREILMRDLKECAICLIMEQNKATIIICGSIIEALLMNKIIENSIDKYDIGSLSSKNTKLKKVIDMDINELLYVADNENLIRKEYFHLSHFARSYRNIIHPACEIRKKFEISNEQAKFMWDILLRIMRDILS